MQVTFEQTWKEVRVEVSWLCGAEEPARVTSLRPSMRQHTWDIHGRLRGLQGWSSRHERRRGDGEEVGEAEWCACEVICCRSAPCNILKLGR